METTVVEEIGLICPACGYDLRATVGGRCSECGREFTALELEKPGFPWARHKGVMGYVKTALMVMFCGRAFGYEGHKRQEFKLARGCRWISAVLFGGALVVLSMAAMRGIMVKNGTPQVRSPASIVQKWDLFSRVAYNKNPILWEIQVVWTKAMQITGVWEGLLFVLGADWVYMMGGMLRNKKASEIRKEQGRSMACYLSAMFFWPGLALGILAAGVVIKPLPRNFYTMAALGLWGWVWLMCAVRVIQWRGRLFKKGWVDGLFVFFRMGAGLAGRAVFWLGFLPVVLGYVIIMVWSLGLE